MNFILNALGTIFNKLFGNRSEKTENSQQNTNVTRIENTNALAYAHAAAIWLCVICLAIPWIVQYLFADYMWIMDCLAHHAIVKFPLDDQKLLNLLYSVLGLSAIGVGAHTVHKLFKRI